MIKIEQAERQVGACVGGRAFLVRLSQPLSGGAVRDRAEGREHEKVQTQSSAGCALPDGRRFPESTAFPPAQMRSAQPDRSDLNRFNLPGSFLFVAF